MKKIFLAAMLFAAVVTADAETKVNVGKLAKSLEKPKNETVFKSDVNWADVTISGGSVSIRGVNLKKARIESGIETELLGERVKASGKNTFELTFTLKGENVYALTKVSGIESVKDYKARVAKEAEEERRKNIAKYRSQVVTPDTVNVSGSEGSWLPGQIQDKLKSNLQEHLGMKTFVDSASEAKVKQLQKESEGAGRDESTAIELGKISTASFGLFSKIRRTNSGYTLSVDFTDLTTGEQVASAVSKEYASSESLYGSTGAVDEVTLSLAAKLGIELSDVTKNLLSSGSSDFSVDAQMALARQTEEKYKKMMSDYDAELSKLSATNDINATQNRKRIEAEKALVAEKQKSEQRRLTELAEQKKRAEADAKLEAERSIGLKTQRDALAKEAAAKAAEVRKLKMEKQGVLGQIGVIEAKKKALVEIREGVEARQKELLEQTDKDVREKENEIKNAAYRSTELSDGKPTQQAIQRRNNNVAKFYREAHEKFYAEATAAAKAAKPQADSLLAEIRGDLKGIQSKRTVSSMGDELKMSYGTYDGDKGGWNAFMSLYSDGILLYSDTFTVDYKAVTGKDKKSVDSMSDEEFADYSDTVDMYNSLLTRGDPILYFELDYSVRAQGDDSPSAYDFTFQTVRAINTVTGKLAQTVNLSKTVARKMTPEQDLRETESVAAQEREVFKDLERLLAKGFTFAEARSNIRWFRNSFDMVKIPNKNYEMLKTEVTQELYKTVTGELPNKNDSRYENEPVRNVSWYDAIYFCNKLSEMLGYTPVYAVNGGTDIPRLEYEKQPEWRVTQDSSADGFRLPTLDEWKYAARGGQNYKYAGSNDIDEVAWWFYDNGHKEIHPVAMKKANGYGLYDMSGNVTEWVWDNPDNYASYDYRYTCGGALCSSYSLKRYTIDGEKSYSAYKHHSFTGFRFVRNVGR